MKEELKNLDRLCNKYQFNDLRQAVEALKIAISLEEPVIIEVHKEVTKPLSPAVIKGLKVAGMKILVKRAFDDLDDLTEELLNHEIEKFEAE